MYIKQDHERQLVCVRAKACLFSALRSAGDQPVLGHCPFGMLEVTWPVIVQGQLVGSVGAGMYRGEECAVKERFAYAHRRYGASLEEMHALYERSTLPRGPLQIAAESQLPLYASALSAWVTQGCVDMSSHLHTQRRFISEALAYIRTHAGEDLTVPQVARHLNISVSYLQHLFQRVRGRSVMRTITDTRLEWAQQLVNDGHLSIAEIASTCGFSDPNYFSTVFARRFGMPPSAYRRGPR